MWQVCVKKLHKCLQYGLKCYHYCLGNKSFSPGKTTAAKNWLLCNSCGKKRVKEGEEKKKTTLHLLMVPGVSIQTRC